MSDVKNSSLATGLVSYWELEETSGTRVDSHGSNDLTDNNTVGSATGIQGTGADFEASNVESLSITDATQTGLDLSTDFSIATWVNFESYPPVQAGLVCKWQTSTGKRSWMFYVQSNELRLVTSPSGTWTGSLGGVSWTPSNGVWYHIACTFDVSAGSVIFYLNGSQLGTAQNGLATSIYNGTSDVVVGGNSDNYLFDGVMDEVGIWSRALSASDVTALYNSGAGIPYDAGGASYTGDIKSVAGVLQADVKSISGVANADIKSFQGVSNV